MKNKVITSEEVKANVISYMVQDMLDTFSSGGRFNFKKFEKAVLNIIKSKDL
jgi:hypothetical protein